jgi:hypothetical protein
MTPTRLILSPDIFNKYQKLFISRRPQDRGGRYAAPFPTRQGFDEIFQFPQNSLMYCRVRYHTRTSICLLFPGLELRFDLRDDFT